MNELTSGYWIDVSFYRLISPVLASQYNIILESEMGVIYGVTSFNYHQSINHFNSHILVIEFPAASISSANTPIILFRKDNCPVEDVLLLKNTEP